MQKFILYLSLGGLAIIVIFFLNIGLQKSNSALDAFAQCLSGKNIVMYGAGWCSHCQNEKKNFGSSFKHISYVECPKDPQKCLAMGIEGYPTWIFPDGYSPTGSSVKGKRLMGEQGLEKLARESGCLLTNK